MACEMMSSSRLQQYWAVIIDAIYSSCILRDILRMFVLNSLPIAVSYLKR